MRKMFKNAKAKHGLNKTIDLRPNLVSIEREHTVEGEKRMGEEEEEEEEEKKKRSQDKKGMELHGIRKFCMNFHVCIVISLSPKT